MKTSALYAKIAHRGFSQIREGKEQVDTWLRQADRDSRMGLSLLLRIPEHVKQAILPVENRMREIEPNLYGYPASDYHITVLDIRAAKPGFQYTKEELDGYQAALSHVVRLFQPFFITLCGVIPSEGAILVKGYPEPALQNIRQGIRDELKRRCLPLEERYETISCHITIARFAALLERRERLLPFLSENTTCAFGTFRTERLQLVYHNWYDSRKTLLAEYPLGGQA